MNKITVTISFTDPKNKDFNISLQHNILTDEDIEVLKAETEKMINRSKDMINLFLNNNPL